MAYSAVADVQNLIPAAVLAELTSEEAPFTTVDSDVVEAAIYQADREIDGYLVRRMAVPLADVPMLITSLSAKMAVHYLHVRRHIQSDVWGAEYERCIKTLRDIYDGKMGLGPGDEADAPASEAVRSSMGSRARRFTSDVWGTY